MKEKEENRDEKAAARWSLASPQRDWSGPRLRREGGDANQEMTAFTHRNREKAGKREENDETGYSQVLIIRLAI